MTTEPKQRIKIAIQKKGRLHDDTLNMFKNAGFRFTRDSTGFIMPCENAEFDLVLLRDDDIPTVVAQGACELGIVGKNVLFEDVCREKYTTPGGDSEIEQNTKELKELPFGKCRLSLAASNNNSYYRHFHNIASLNNVVNVATSYPYSLIQYAKQNKLQLKPKILKGSVEIAPRLKITDIICDLVSSGLTLKQNELMEVPSGTVLESTAIVIGNKNFNEDYQTYKDIILKIDASFASQGVKYIMLNCEEQNVEKIVEILPSAKTPTIIPLAENGMRAIHAMCKEGELWSKYQMLQDAGATSILVMSVEKVM